MDWAIELYNWFNYYLKDIGEEPSAIAQVQTNDGHWHAEETWPPEDKEWERITLDAADSSGNWVSSTISASFTVPGFDEDMHISGLPTLHLSVNSPWIPCDGGQVFATMFDDETGLRLGHATMDLRYRDGGYEANMVVPGQNYLMLMEFNPLDVMLPAGHAIRVDLTESGEDYLPSPCALTGIGISLDESSELGLPIIHRPSADHRWFKVPQLEVGEEA
jgi:predicted acyl esterase